MDRIIACNAQLVFRIRNDRVTGVSVTVTPQMPQALEGVQGRIVVFIHPVHVTWSARCADPITMPDPIAMIIARIAASRWMIGPFPPVHVATAGPGGQQVIQPIQQGEMAVSDRSAGSASVFGIVAA